MKSRHLRCHPTQSRLKRTANNDKMSSEPSSHTQASDNKGWGQFLSIPLPNLNILRPLAKSLPRSRAGEASTEAFISRSTRNQSPLSSAHTSKLTQSENVRTLGKTQSSTGKR